MEEFLEILYRYRYGNVLWIGIIYPIWFKSLESRITVSTGYHIMHTHMDDLIPFCEWFIVPYFLWFIYIFAGLVYFMFTNKEDFYKVSLFLFIGMIASLVICEIYPNGTDFRPAYLSEKNIFHDYGKESVSSGYSDQCLSQYSCLQLFVHAYRVIKK